VNNIYSRDKEENIRLTCLTPIRMATPPTPKKKRKKKKCWQGHENTGLLCTAGREVHNAAAVENIRSSNYTSR
jgi:hypothetical protein